MSEEDWKSLAHYMKYISGYVPEMQEDLETAKKDLGFMTSQPRTNYIDYAVRRRLEKFKEFAKYLEETLHAESLFVDAYREKSQIKTKEGIVTVSTTPHWDIKSYKTIILYTMDEKLLPKKISPTDIVFDSSAAIVAEYKTADEAKKAHAKLCQLALTLAGDISGYTKAMKKD